MAEQAKGPGRIGARFRKQFQELRLGGRAPPPEERPDLVIRFGGPLTSKTATNWLDSSVPQILVDPDGRLRRAELFDNEDGTLSIFGTMVDHAASKFSFGLLRPGTDLNKDMRQKVPPDLSSIEN